MRRERLITSESIMDLCVVHAFDKEKHLLYYADREKLWRELMRDQVVESLITSIRTLEYIIRRRNVRCARETVSPQAYISACHCPTGWGGFVVDEQIRNRRYLLQEFRPINPVCAWESSAIFFCRCSIVLDSSSVTCTSAVPILQNFFSDAMQNESRASTLCQSHTVHMPKRISDRHADFAFCWATKPVIS